MNSLTTIVLGASLLSAPQPADLVFENDLVRWTIGSDGQNKSLVEKDTGKELLAAPGGCMFAIRQGDQTFEDPVIRRDGERLYVNFGRAGVNAEYRIVARPRYFVVEFVRAEGEKVD